MSFSSSVPYCPTCCSGPRRPLTGQPAAFRSLTAHRCQACHKQNTGNNEHKYTQQNTSPFSHSSALSASADRVLSLLSSADFRLSSPSADAFLESEEKITKIKFEREGAAGAARGPADFAALIGGLSLLSSHIRCLERDAVRLSGDLERVKRIAKDSNELVKESENQYAALLEELRRSRRSKRVVAASSSLSSPASLAAALADRRVASERQQQRQQLEDERRNRSAKAKAEISAGKQERDDEKMRIRRERRLLIERIKAEAEAAAAASGTHKKHKQQKQQTNQWQTQKYHEHAQEHEYAHNAADANDGNVSSFSSSSCDAGESKEFALEINGTATIHKQDKQQQQQSYRDDDSDSAAAHGDGDGGARPHEVGTFTMYRLAKANKHRKT